MLISPKELQVLGLSKCSQPSITLAEIIYHNRFGVLKNGFGILLFILNNLSKLGELSRF
jgi:hypothetical protein